MGICYALHLVLRKLLTRFLELSVCHFLLLRGCGCVSHFRGVHHVAGSLQLHGGSVVAAILLDHLAL
ncbi:hypothetical protein KC19_VG188500 [Ceratodon purpureus]|uniref:Secreted protein n=1 Tax=Ceratodon purpureus TaxID=3225 RepID=A0A8T0HRZ7_CERPU|nr:hypothetical protein KC19_VG188500 [Ceratodon purpureus]